MKGKVEKIVVREGYAAINAENSRLAISHENCDWEKPLCFDDISNAIVMSTAKNLAAHIVANDRENRFSGDCYQIRRVKVTVEIGKEE